ncbi:glycosyl hydrolase family 28-related protein [Natribacillus halophilus]|uniref:Pectate lyase superfamily protein n=1 Tax=Natribacillus halophilus TaxID=549003 RepID=A0A1G8RRW3_9BACI|nr:glycosyl hydrolase family 28-related protein [Natribacillus halophilus]SDJ19707.1 Pectate lyase superfamily protein [Natribacillus halophilus]
MSRFEKMRIMPVDSLFDENYYVTTNRNFERFNMNIDAMQVVEDIADQAGEDSEYARNKADNVQSQLDQAVIDGDSSVEAAQARVDLYGKDHDTLKSRLDVEQKQLDGISINANFHGAVNDGETDNTEVVNELLNDLHDIGGGTLYFPTGEYYFESNVILEEYENVVIKGDGESTILKNGQGIDHLETAFFNISDSKNITIDNLMFDCNNLTPTPIRFTDSSHIYISRVNLINPSRHEASVGEFRIALVYDCEFVNMENIKSNYGIAGVNGVHHFYGNRLWAESTHELADEMIDFNSAQYVHLSNSYAKGFGEMFDMGASSYVSVRDCITENCDTAINVKEETAREGFSPAVFEVNITNINIIDCVRGINFNGAAGEYGGDFYNFYVGNCSIHQRTSADNNPIRMLTSGIDDPRNITIENCILYGNGEETGIYYSGSGIADLNIRNNKIENCRIGIFLGYDQERPGVQIENNKIVDTSQQGIYTNFRSAGYMDLHILNNRLLNCGSEGYSGLYVYTPTGISRNAIVQRNIVDYDDGEEKPNNAIEFVRIDYVMATNNYIHEDTGISYRSASTNLIRNNANNTIDVNDFDVNAPRYGRIYRFNEIDFNIGGGVVTEGIISANVDTSSNEIVVLYDEFQNHSYGQYPVILTQVEQRFNDAHEYTVIPDTFLENGEIRLKVYKNGEEADLSDATNRLGLYIYISI